MNMEMIIFLIFLGVIAVAEVIGMLMNFLSYRVTKKSKVVENSVNLVMEQMNRERNNFEEYKRNATETIRYWVGLVEKAQAQGFIPNENKTNEKKEEDNGDEKVS